MHGAILNGLSRPLDSVQQQVTVKCPSGNCTFSSFETLDVCHRCADVSSNLEKDSVFGDVFKDFLGLSDRPRIDGIASGKGFHKDDASAYALPNGHFLMNPNGCYTTEKGIGLGCD